MEGVGGEGFAQEVHGNQSAVIVEPPASRRDGASSCARRTAVDLIAATAGRDRSNENAAAAAKDARLDSGSLARGGRTEEQRR